MAQHPGYQQVLKPYLLNKLNQSFPDPSQFTKEEEFVYAAKVASVFKKVVAELLMFIDQKNDEADYLKKKELGEIKDNFAIGADELIEEVSNNGS